MLTVYDVVASACPLVADRYEIDVDIQSGVVAITETLVVNNPTSATYAGAAGKDVTSETLALAIPEGFERVTFHSEFHGRNFQLADKRVVTNIPWPPGKRELKFTYHLPAEGVRQILERALDLPCPRVRVHVRGEDTDRVDCNLPRATAPDGPGAVFESSGQPLAAGHRITLRFGGLTVPWVASARWVALGILAALILLTVGLRTMRRPIPQPRRRSEDHRPSKPGRNHHHRRRRVAGPAF
jgi:hypothetical protein